MICYLKYGFQDCKRNVLYRFRNQVIVFEKKVSKLALVLLLNTNERFRVVIEMYSTAFGTYTTIFLV